MKPEMEKYEKNTKRECIPNKEYENAMMGISEDIMAVPAK